LDPAAPLLALADLAGIALALLLAALLWVHGEGPRRRANVWLALAIAAVGLMILGRQPSLPLASLAGGTAFLFGPCLWLYACRATGLDGPRGQRLAVHFIPAVAMLLVLLPKQPAEAVRLVQPRTAPDALAILTAVHMLAYWLLASLRLGRAGERSLRLRLWVCMAAWALWVASSA
jgi:hypothetical protein